MISISGMKAVSGFAIDHEEVRQTARRQFSVSVALVGGILAFALVSQMTPSSQPASTPLAGPNAPEAMLRVAMTRTIKSEVRYHDHGSSATRFAFVAN